MSIKEKQNEQEILKLQYAARHTYNLAEVFGLFSWVLTFIVIFISWYSDGSTSIGFAYAVAIITIINSLIDYIRERAIKFASGIRSYIDCYLFNDEYKKMHSGFSVKCIKYFGDIISKLHKKTYLKQIANTGESKYRGVKDWYSLNNGMSFEEEIISAQKENCYFDKNISRDSGIITLILSIIFIISIVKLDQGFLLLCAFIPIWLKLIKSAINYSDYKKIANEENVIISKLDDCGYDEKLSIQLQECINERRQLYFVTFSFIHKLKADYMHYKVKNTNEYVNK